MTEWVGFAGRHADVYERLIVPGQIAPFADVLPALPWPGGRLLDVACGAGFVRDALGDQFETIVGVDASADMAARGPAAVAGDAQALPFVDSSFDAATCVFGWMFFESLGRAAREARRVLRPGALYASLVWRPIHENPYPLLAKRVAAEWFPDEPPTYYEIAFQPYATAQTISALRNFGFRVDHDVVERMGAFPDARSYAEAFVFGNVRLQRLAQLRGLDPRAFSEALERAAVAEYGDRPCSAPMRADLILAQA